MNEQQSQDLLLKVDRLLLTDNELIAQGEERETTSAKLLLVFSRL